MISNKELPSVPHFLWESSQLLLKLPLRCKWCCWTNIFDPTGSVSDTSPQHFHKAQVSCKPTTIAALWIPAPLFFTNKSGITLFQQVREYSYKLCNWQINEGHNFSGTHRQLNKVTFSAALGWSRGRYLFSDWLYDLYLPFPMKLFMC